MDSRFRGVLIASRMVQRSHVYLRRGGRRLGIEATLASVHWTLNVGRIVSAAGNALRVETSRSIAELQHISYREDEREQTSICAPSWVKHIQWDVKTQLIAEGQYQLELQVVGLPSQSSHFHNTASEKKVHSGYVHDHESRAEGKLCVANLVHVVYVHSCIH